MFSLPAFSPHCGFNCIKNLSDSAIEVMLSRFKTGLRYIQLRLLFGKNISLHAYYVFTHETFSFFSLTIRYLKTHQLTNPDSRSTYEHTPNVSPCRDVGVCFMARKHQTGVN